MDFICRVLSCGRGLSYYMGAVPRIDVGSSFHPWVSFPPRIASSPSSQPPAQSCGATDSTHPTSNSSTCHPCPPSLRPGPSPAPGPPLDPSFPEPPAKRARVDDPALPPHSLEPPADPNAPLPEPDDPTPQEPAPSVVANYGVDSLAGFQDLANLAVLQ